MAALTPTLAKEIKNALDMILSDHPAHLLGRGSHGGEE
jgi:hypothetical protein